MHLHLDRRIENFEVNLMSWFKRAFIHAGRGVVTNLFIVMTKDPNKRFGERHPKTAVVVTYWLPIIAFVISCTSLYLYIRGAQISEAGLSLQLNPILSTGFEINGQGDTTYFQLLNDGPNDIFEIHVRKMLKVYNATMNHWGSIMQSRVDWQYVDKLETSTSRRFLVPLDELERVLGMAGSEPRYQPDSMKHHQRVPVIAFYITFRRQPDRSMYKTQKYLIVGENSSNGKPMPFDPDGFFGDFRTLKKQMEMLDAY